MSDAPHESKKHTHAERMELAATILLGLAALATAWSSYQASRWHGEQAQAQSRATATRLESTRASGVANREAEIDVQLFIQWVDAHQQRDTKLANFYRSRFTDRLERAFPAWIATMPFENADAPPSPFAMPAYRLAETGNATRLEAQAAAATEEAKEDIQRADNYVLSAVLFAAALFFGGLSLRLRTETGRVRILGMGYVLLAGAGIWVATFPVNVGV
jgi:hypothetical protein